VTLPLISNSWLVACTSADTSVRKFLKDLEQASSDTYVNCFSQWAVLIPLRKLPKIKVLWGTTAYPPTNA